MHIVIDIPEEDYIRLRDEGMFGNVTTFKRAVREGTPLDVVKANLITTYAEAKRKLGSTYGSRQESEAKNESI